MNANNLRIAPETVDTHDERTDMTTERIRLFANAIRLIVQEPDSQEKREVMAEVEGELEEKHRIGNISDVQRIELLRLLYGQNRVAVYYYDPNKRTRKAGKK